MKKKLVRNILLLLYPLLDYSAILLSLVSSYYIYRFLELGQVVFYDPEDVWLIGAIVSGAAILVMFFFGCYKKEASILNVEEITNVVKAITTTFTIFVFFLVFAKIDLSRYVTFISYGCSLLALIAMKTFLYHSEYVGKFMKRLQTNVLIYGAGELGQALYRELVNSPKLHLNPIGFIDDDKKKQEMQNGTNGVKGKSGGVIFGTRSEVLPLIKEYNIKEILVAISNIDFKEIIDIINYFKDKQIPVAFVPNLYEIYLPKADIMLIGQIPLVRDHTQQQSFYLRYIKRWLDIILSILILLIIWPLWLAIAVIIKIDSKGPVFFDHERVGKDGKSFRIIKFRTMHLDVDPYAVNPLTDKDQRITKAGRLLRKSSLDELPQLINVIKGDMSLVGPRPEMPFIVKEYKEIHKERLKILPGITGLWQLSADRNKAIHENMDYDLFYIRKVSFFLDLVIMIETLIFAFRGI